MKKTAACFVLIAGIAVALSSCTSMFYAMGSKTYQLIVDKNVPADQCAVVTFSIPASFAGFYNVNGCYFVSEWNNTGIVDELYGAKGVDALNFADKTKLTVPAGNTSFTFDLYFVLDSQTSIRRYTLKQIELRYDLEPEKEYQVKASVKTLGLTGFEFFVGIYDADGATLLKEWKLGEST